MDKDSRNGSKGKNLASTVPLELMPGLRDVKETDNYKLTPRNGLNL